MNMRASEGEKSKLNKLLPPPTPSVILTLPSGATCNSVLTASGCGAATVAWFTGSVFYSSANPLTVTNLTPVILKAACFDGVSYGSYSPEYKAVTATYTEITPTTSVTICNGNTATLNASSAFAGLSYQWIKNGTNISGATAASYGATTAGNYNVFATNGSCSSTSLGKSVTATTITTPIISVSTTGSCGSQTITMSTQSLPAGTFQWKLNGTDISGATSSSYATTVAGSYTVVYTYNGCVATSVAYYFNQNAAPTVTLVPPVSPDCYSNLLVASGCAGTVNWYKWNISNFQGSGNTFFIGQLYPPEEYFATCTVNGCTSPSSNVVKASGYSYTEIIPKVSVICGGTSLLNASSVNSGLTYQWKRNNVNISGATSSTYSVTLGGQYSLEVSNGGCIIFTENATVFADLAITGSASGACGSQSVNMSLPAILPLGTYQWKLNGNPISGATASTYVTSTQGIYTVDYTFNSCTVTSLPYTFSQSPPSIALVPPVSPSCNSTLTATGCSGTVRWYRNAGSSYIFVTTGNPFIFPITGITEYRATCSIASCESLPSNVVAAIPNNFTEVTPTNPVLCGGSALLNASSTFSGLTYQWSNSIVGNISGATSSSYTATVAAGYRVFVTNGTCSYLSPTVTVTNPVTPVTFTSFTGTCGSQTLTISTQLGLPGTFQWKLNGIDISGATSSSYSTTTAGSYTVAYTYGGCTLTSLAYVFVQNNVPVITLNPAVSPSCSSSLSASGCSGTVYWYRNTGSSWSFETFGNTYFFPASNKPPEYRATCFANDCESTPSNVLKATPNIFTEITPSPSVTICSNASTLLNASSTFSGLTYQWRLNNSNISGANASSYTATSAGNYSLYVTNGSCVFGTLATTVFVTTAPTLSITSTVTSPATITNGQSLTLNANGCSGGTVLWSNSATTTSITVSPSSNTTYTFTCTQPPCIVTSSGFVVNVNALSPPTLSSSAVSTCTGSSVTLTATACAGGGTVTWSTSQTGLTISVSPTLTTSYTATCTVGSVTSANSSPISVAVFDGVITSLASGDWNTPATWSCNCIPAACNDVIVDTGHVVTIPVTQKGRLQNLTLRGTVDVKTTGTMALK